MNPRETLIAFLAAARHCAMEMAGNAQYIRDELPRVELPAGLADALGEACDELISTKFDTISGLSDLDDAIGADSLAADLAASAARILRHLDTAVVSLHPACLILQEAVEEDGRYHLAYLLVTESAVNILNAHAEIPRIKAR